MDIRIYNTLSRSKERFEPLEEGKVGIYFCGPTVYSSAHIGHARSALVFDVIARYLRFRGFDVTLARNYTDVDDKIIRRANEEGVAPETIAERYIEEYARDMRDLGLDEPDHTPRVTETMDAIIEMVTQLIDNGHAYAADNGDVYFAVQTWPGYGELSGRDPEQMLAGARVDVNDDKRSPMDFALWKATKPGEPSWPSPWGEGRPGWHIECSAMSTQLFGDTFDIHGGGLDLVFPHHENEIAQARGACGGNYAKVWMHNGIVRINAEKMSKSLKNFVTLRDMLQAVEPEVIRTFMLDTHYRSPVDYNAEQLADAEYLSERIYAALHRLDGFVGDDDVPSSTPEVEALPQLCQKVHSALCGLRERFISTMDEDFNTAGALGHVCSTVRAVNRLFSKGDEAELLAAKPLLALARRDLRELGGAIGLFQDDPAAYLARLRGRRAAKLDVDVATVTQLVDERNEARQTRDWERADALRDKLDAIGVELLDSPEGTTWRPRIPAQDAA
jgi:cysteinyl-tRNA synthetase